MSAHQWKVRALFGEAVRNVLGGHLRVAVLSALALGAMVQVADAVSWVRYQRHVAAEWRAGVNTFVFVADSPDGGIEGRSCRQLGSVVGVVAAVPVKERGTIRVGALGWVEWPLRSIDDRGGLVESEAAAGFTLLADADVVQQAIDTQDEDGAHVRLVPHGGVPKAFDLSSALLARENLDGELVETCLVVVEPDLSRSDGFRAVLAAALSAVDVRVLARVDDVDVETARARFRGDPERWSPVAAVMVLVMVVLLVSKARASELAVYRLVGTTRVDLALLMTFETMLVSMCLGASMFAAAVAGQLLWAVPAELGVALEAIAVVALVPMCVTASLPTRPMWAVVDAVKDR